MSLQWHFKARLIRKDKGDGITHLRVCEKDELPTRGLTGKQPSVRGVLSFSLDTGGLLLGGDRP